MIPFYKTLKFWLAVTTVTYLVLKHYFPNIPFLTEEWLQGILLTLVVWLVGGPLEVALRGVYQKLTGKG